MNNNRARAWDTVLFGVLTGIAVCGAGAIMAESEITLINIWVFLSILLIIGGGFAWLMRRTRVCSAFPWLPEWLNILFIAVLFTSITGGGILLVNSLCSDSEKMDEREVIVERKIIKTRHRTQSSGRRTYSTGTPYKVYYLELKMADGRKIEIKPEYDVYKKAEKGDTAYLRAGRGALFLPVCDMNSLRLKHPRAKRHRPNFYRHKRSRNVDN